MALLRKYTRWILLFVFLNMLLLCFSYYKSKSIAEEIMGETLKYFPLSKSGLVIEPYEKKQIVWEFKFSLPDAFDEDFFIYTSLLGDILVTNPKDIVERLRGLEELDPHPYSKEGLEQKRRPKKIGVSQ